jgi:probable F420-dependent oxidoreductase
MRVGVVVPMSASDGGQMPTWQEIGGFARHAEQRSFDSLWVCDHFISDPGDRPPEGIHEAWTILSALAASTTSVELGQLVMCAPFRSPGLLAKMATTADTVSGGRLILGLGAGWYDAEFTAFGYPTDHRVSRLEETIQIINGLLDGERVTFAGRFHTVHGAELLPPPDRRIPVLVAGNGPRMLEIAAKHADAWNTAWFGAPDDRLRERLAALAPTLKANGRDIKTIRRTVGVWVEDPEVVPVAVSDPEAFRGSIDDLSHVLQAYEGLAIDDLIVGLTPMNIQSLDRLARARDHWRGGATPSDRR